MEGRVSRRFRWNPKLGELVEVDLGRDDDAPQAPAVFGDLPAYESPIDGRMVEGRRERREDLKRSGCRPYEAGETQQMQQRRAAADAALERNVSETVDRWWHNAPTHKREALARELLSGADTQYVRK